jgi:hypothetical protein
MMKEKGMPDLDELKKLVDFIKKEEIKKIIKPSFIS